MKLHLSYEPNKSRTYFNIDQVKNDKYFIEPNSVKTKQTIKSLFEIIFQYISNTCYLLYET